MAKIIVLDPLAEDGLKMMQDAGIEYDVRTGLKGEELREALAEYDGAICRSGVKITAEALEGVKRLKAIARAGVAVIENPLRLRAARNGDRRERNERRRTQTRSPNSSV